MIAEISNSKVTWLSVDQLAALRAVTERVLDRLQAAVDN